MTVKGKRKREYGIDLLRVVSMFMVVVLHVLLQGGVLANAKMMSSQYLAAWFLEMTCFCAVNVFAMISGYVGLKSKCRLGRLFSLWLQVVFYTVLFTIICALTVPDLLEPGIWIKMWFPITSGMYWYITAYAGIYMFTPLMNAAVEHTPRKQLELSLLASFVLLCILPVFVQSNAYALNAGYSMVWIGIMYLAGAYLKKYNVPAVLTKSKAALVFLASTLLSFGGRLLVVSFLPALAAKPDFIAPFASYLSPLMVINAAALVCFFAHVKCRFKPVRMMVTLLAPAALGVYIIHLYPVIWDHVISNMAIGLASAAPVGLVFGVLGYALGIYALCSALEVLRLRLFKMVQQTMHKGRS